MSPRQRPADCCSPPLEAPDLPVVDRDRLVTLHRALGDATRFEIFRLIAAQSGPVCVCDVVDRFDLTQPTISHHLKVLRQAGIADSERQGLWAYYYVVPEAIEEFQSWLSR